MLSFYVLLIGGIVGLLISGKAVNSSNKKIIGYEINDETKKAGKEKIVNLIWMAFVLISAILILVAIISSDIVRQETENPIVVTIDKLIAGEEVPVQEMRSLLAVPLYPSVEGWANVKNIPKEKKEYVISVVAKAIRKATVKIELPPDFLSNVETAGVPLQTQKEN